jgi:hypothetical protein
LLGILSRLSPFPSLAEAMPTSEGFADMMMECTRNSDDGQDLKSPITWHNVGLMPLSHDQRRQFVEGHGISDPDALLADIRSRNAEEFAERPQDLIELCADWREHHRLRSHRDQVETDIAYKQKPRTNRQERTELSQETAQGLKVMRSSMRPVAAWLTSWHATIFDDLVRLDPADARDRRATASSRSTTRRYFSLDC